MPTMVIDFPATPEGPKKHWGKCRRMDMKKTLRCFLMIIFSMAFCSWFSAISAEVTLEVLNPLGEIVPPPTLGLNTRIPDLNGKTVALMDNWKTGGVYLQDRFEELLKKKYPSIKILRTTKPQGRQGGGRLIWSADSWYSEVAKSADAFIYTISD
jgi:hypothetical protein